jgi:putative transposase
MTERAVRKHIESSALPAEKQPTGRGGNSGISYRIPVAALPPEAQLVYYQEAGKSQAGDRVMDADLVTYREKYGPKALDELLRAQRMVLIAKGIRESAEGQVQKRLDALASENGTTMRTLYRWEKQFAESGLKGLMKKERKDAGQPRTMCLEARRYMWEQYLGPNRRTQEQLLRMARDKAEIEGAKACANCPFREGSQARAAMDAETLEHYPACDCAGEGMIPPSNRTSVNRIIEQLTPAEKAYMRQGRKVWEAAFMFKNQREKPNQVNLCWFGDHHQFDCFVVDTKGRAIRPWVTLWYDIGSGEPVGYCLSECPNSQTIMEAFTRAVAEKRNSPICGLPVYVYTDNGKDYRAERFEGGKFIEISLGDLNEKVRMATMGADGVGTESIYSLFDVQVVHAKEYHGWAKPVERWFRTLEDRFIREIPGYCGNSPKSRPENFDRTLKALLERGELLSMDELFARFRDEMIPMYNETAHEGYDGQTPAWRYANLPKARNEVPSWSMLALAKEDHDKRMVNPMGIRYKSSWYWDYELTQHVGEWVQIRFNRDHVESLTVCTMPAKGKPARFICEAGPKEKLQMVGEDEEKLKRYVAIPKIQERELRQGLISKGVKLPGKRSSGHVYVDEIDVKYAKGNISNLEYERMWLERENARKRRNERDEVAAGKDEGSDHFRRKGAELLELARAKNA